MSKRKRVNPWAICNAQKNRSGKKWTKTHKEKCVKAIKKRMKYKS